MTSNARKLLKWDPDRPNVCDTTISYSLQCAQRKQCRVTIAVYDLNGQKVYEETQMKLCPGDHPWSWNGRRNVGFSGVAPWGLYTFNIFVEGALPYDKDSLRSNYLSFFNNEFTQRTPTWTSLHAISGETSLSYMSWFCLFSNRIPQKNDATAYITMYHLETFWNRPLRNFTPILCPANWKSAPENMWNKQDFGHPLTYLGNWVAVVEAYEPSEFGGLYKSHTSKWTRPIGMEILIPTAACFDLVSGLFGNEAEQAAYYLRKVYPVGRTVTWSNDRPEYVLRYPMNPNEPIRTRYTSWRWWNPQDKEFIFEWMAQKHPPPETVARALRRVGIFFAYAHGRGDVIGQHNRVYLAVSGNQGYLISNFPDGDLNNLLLACIIACGGRPSPPPEEVISFPQNYPLLDWMLYKGAKMGVALVSNIGFVDSRSGRIWGRRFWEYLTLNATQVEQGWEYTPQERHRGVSVKKAAWYALWGLGNPHSRSEIDFNPPPGGPNFNHRNY